MAIGSHQSTRSGSVDWITPPCVVEALGSFDLDPCASVSQPFPQAERSFTVFQDGLKQPWVGRVWLNPPYGRETGVWLARLADHGCGTALIFARTETRMFSDHVWGKASGLLFLRDRLFFHYPDGRRARNGSGGPSVLVAYGESDAIALRDSGLAGAYMGNWSVG